MRAELTERILPYWSGRAVDQAGGGFFGYIGPTGEPDPAAPRAANLMSRILWTFSAARRVLGDPSLSSLADRAADVLLTRFLDSANGGVYWTVDRSGRPVDDRKHIYAQAFAVYGLAEHYQATGREESLREARSLFRLVESRAHDAVCGGYREAFSRDWVPLEDARLGETDLNAPKSANTHLHLLEAYTALLRVWPDPGLASRLRALLELFLDRIVNPTSRHLRPFFDAAWTPRSEVVSFGHDIEASWLLGEAAAALQDPALSDRTERLTLALADAVLEDGLDPMGGVFYLADPAGAVDREKEWWTQAEAIIGFLHAYQRTERQDFLAAAWATWDFVKAHMLDHDHGEWYRRVDRDGTPQTQHEKVGPWKGPYHNGRACLEVMRRVAGA